jgi:hypothetical protein
MNRLFSFFAIVTLLSGVISCNLPGQLTAPTLPPIATVAPTTVEPPLWRLQPVIAKQTVIITVPGSAPKWRVVFYSTGTGTDIVGSATVNREGNSLTITLPDFTDDIAFKLNVQE